MASFTANILILVVSAFIVILGTTLLFMWLRTRPCDDAPFNAYEHFADASAPVAERIEKIRALRDQLEEDLDALGTIEDDTCDIMSQIEDNVVSTAAIPRSSTEYDLPAEVQQRRAEERKRRAAARFKQRRSDAGVLECFAGAICNASVADLVQETAQLRELLNRATVRAEAAQAGAAFNEVYLKEAVDAATGSEEGFADTDAAIAIADADREIGRALAFRLQIVDLQKTLAAHKKLAEGINKKTQDLSRGRFNPGDLTAGVGAATAGVAATTNQFVP
jgi:hypothetical protein